MRLNRKKIIFITITAIICAVVIEVSLQALALLSPPVDVLLSSPWETRAITSALPDERLGYRPNPAYPGHDRKGFRNPRVLKTAHIVALGDSQTYGSGVEAHEAWPRILEAMSKRSVYSMAFGGWGPAHSLLLWDEAIELKPTVVIEAFYAGNDLYDSFNLVYNKGQLPGLKTDDRHQRDLVTRAEEAEPIAGRVKRIFRMGRATSRQTDKSPPAPSSGEGKSKGSWFSRYSKLYGLLRRTRYELTRPRPKAKTPPSEQEQWLNAQAFAETYSQYYQVFSNERSRTIFSAEYRLSAVNLDDPRIGEGQRISLEAIGRMQQCAADDGIRFIVLLIPTKELVFSKQANGVASASYHAHLRNERRLWEQTKEYLEEHSIEYVDALRPLQAQLEAGPQPYKVTRNGHPNAHGHRVIAQTVHSLLNGAQIQRKAE